MASITSVRRSGAPRNGPVTRTCRGIGSSGRSTPAVAARTPAHGPAALTTTPASTGPSLVSHPQHSASVGPNALDRDAELDLGARAPREGGVPLGEPGGVGDPVPRAVRRPHQALGRDPRRQRGRLLRREDLGLDPERRVQLVRREEVAPQGLVPHQEQVAVLRDVEGKPVLLGEPDDHRDARLRQPHVDRARELVAEAPGTRAGRTRRDVIRALEDEDAAGAGGGEVVRGARADDPRPHHDDVGGPVQQEPPVGREGPVTSEGTITQSSPRYASRIKGLSSRFCAVSASTTCPVWIT